MVQVYLNILVDGVAHKILAVRLSNRLASHIMCCYFYLLIFCIFLKNLPYYHICLIKKQLLY